MQINMTTFAVRKQHYIHETIESLFASDWAAENAQLHLIMGSEDESHVQQYASHPSIRIVPWDGETQKTLRRNCTENKVRALRHGDDEALIICEDDISFAPDWFASLKLAIAELGDENYVLSLFAAQVHLDSAEFVEGKSWVKHYPTRVLQGAQAIYHPKKEAREKLAVYLKERITKACGDQLIGRFARGYSALYVTKSVLVSHVGHISTFHQ